MADDVVRCYAESPAPVRPRRTTVSNLRESMDVTSADRRRTDSCRLAPSCSRLRCNGLAASGLERDPPTTAGQANGRRTAEAAGDAVSIRAVLIVVALSALASAQEWPFYGGDPGGTKYSPMKDINRENVTHLRPAWIFHTGDISDGSKWVTRSAFESTPLV